MSKIFEYFKVRFPDVMYCTGNEEEILIKVQKQEENSYLQFDITSDIYINF